MTPRTLCIRPRLDRLWCPSHAASPLRNTASFSENVLNKISCYKTKHNKYVWNKKDDLCSSVVIWPIVVLCLSLGGERTKHDYINGHLHCTTIQVWKHIATKPPISLVYYSQILWLSDSKGTEWRWTHCSKRRKCIKKKNPCTKCPIFIPVVQRMFLQANKSSQCGELGGKQLWYLAHLKCW